MSPSKSTDPQLWAGECGVDRPAPVSRHIDECGQSTNEASSYTCHEGPSDDDRNDNRAPVAHGVAASTDQDVAVEISLSATDADSDSLSLRIVSQPTNGTVGLSGSVATYYPFAGFSGSDSFTFAAWDGSTNSNLGNGTIVVNERRIVIRRVSDRRRP